MKILLKYVLLIGLFCFMSFSSLTASSLFLMNPSDTIHTIEGSPDEFEIVFVHKIKNSAIETKNVKIRVDVLELTPGHKYSFCDYVQCQSFMTESFETDYSFPMTSQQESDNLFYLALKPDGIEGETKLKVMFFIDGDYSDEVHYTMTFKIGTTGLEDDIFGFDLSEPLPNPANEFASVDYHLLNQTQSSLEIVNSMGDLVQIHQLSNYSDNLLINTSSLPQGIYYCSLIVEGQRISTRRLVVLH